MGAGTRALQARRAGSRFPSLLLLRFPGAPPPGHQAKERGRAEGDPAPSPVPDWLLLLSIRESIFDGGGLPPSLPQITFATGSQPVGPKSAGKKRLGASELGPPVPRPGAPPPGLKRCILPSPVTSHAWKRSGGLAVTQKRNVASRVSRLDARLGWGCGGGTPGAKEDCRGGVMRRGGTLHSPRPRAPLPLARRPPSSQARGRCSTLILVTLRTRDLKRY